jgi:2Fe-2S ferredoxin|tara:strand:+ start:4547 stop:4876 length:330 start_codon:yes stop_codon:yes gene_type:complete
VITVYFIRTNNEKVCVEVPEGSTLMQAAREADLREIPADCGGNCACATCHIHLTNAWSHLLPIKQNSIEQSLLEYEEGYIEGVSRLSCQIKLTKELNNLTVRLRDNELL